MKEKVLVTGKRTGQGFVVPRADLIAALSQSAAQAAMVGDVLVGRQGLIQFLRYVRGGASTVKVVPQSDGLRVEFGSSGMVVLPSWKWVPPAKTGQAEADAAYVEVSNGHRYPPNVGAGDLARALERALVCAKSKEKYGDDVLTCLVFLGDGDTLKVLSSDGHRAAEVAVPCSVWGRGMVHLDEARRMLRVLKGALRARVEIADEEITSWTSEDGLGTKAVPAVTLIADRVKVECTPLDRRHPLAEGFPEKLRVEPQARAYVGARELSEFLRGAGMAADESAKMRPVTIAIRKDMVEFSTASMALAMEAETEGEGELVADAVKLYPIVKSLGTQGVELGLAERMVQVSADGAWFALMGVTVPKAEEQPGAQPVEEAGEEAA